MHWTTNTEPNIFLEDYNEDGSPILPQVKVWLWGNDKDYDRYYDMFSKLESTVNDFAGDMTSMPFNNYETMLAQHDSYAITIEAKFDSFRVGQAICLEEVNPTTSVKAICGE
jgi:hypothetical protein